MLAQNVSFDEVYDKFALRIVYKAIHTMKVSSLENIFHCNRPLSSSPSRLRDWISSLNPPDMKHCTLVMGPKGRWVEVQVRSERG
jgi:GTP pyrophosphokinase